MCLGERARGRDILLVCWSPGGTSYLACSFFFSISSLRLLSPSLSSSSPSASFPSDSGKPAFLSRSSFPVTHGPPGPEVPGQLGTHGPPRPGVPPTTYRLSRAIMPLGSCVLLMLSPYALPQDLSQRFRWLPPAVGLPRAPPAPAPAIPWLAAVTASVNIWRGPTLTSRPPAGFGSVPPKLVKRSWGRNTLKFGSSCPKHGNLRWRALAIPPSARGTVWSRI